MVDIVEHAKELVAYFEDLAQRQSDPIWQEGLDASRQWLSMLEGDITNSQVEEFRRALELVKERHGSGWFDLIHETRRWQYVNQKLQK